MLGWLKPQDKIEQSQQDSGLRQLMYDGALSQTMGVFTGGAFLVAFALLLGASNLVIGLFAAIGPFTQILQIPAVWLVDRTRLRKALVVFSSLASRSFWLIVAVIPWLLPAPLRVPVFVGCLVAVFGLGAISGCAFNSWMRDLIPEQIMGRYFSRRMAVSMALGAVLSMAAAFGVDYASAAWDAELGAYSVLFALGAVAGLAGVFFLMRVPEPKMVPPEEKRSLLASLVRPFRDTNFRRLLHFLAAWNFAANLAGPFFVVFMLRRIGLPMTWIIGLSVLSQLINVAFLRIWGKLADRYTNKSVLAVSGPLFMLSVLLWVFTTLPDRHVLTIPLLIGIHALSGMSTAGVGLCAGNIAMRLAPKGEATSYLAINALVSGLAATVAPILGGLAADFFQTRELAI
ncbi:MAG: MFS transporter, partial [Planctomycetota bacterium]